MFKKVFPGYHNIQAYKAIKSHSLIFDGFYTSLTWELLCQTLALQKIIKLGSKDMKGDKQSYLLGRRYDTQHNDIQ